MLSVAVLYNFFRLIVSGFMVRAGIEFSESATPAIRCNSAKVAGRCNCMCTRNSLRVNLAIIPTNCASVRTVLTRCANRFLFIIKSSNNWVSVFLNGDDTRAQLCLYFGVIEIF